MREDIVPGAQFPDYELSDHMGNLQRLSELQGERDPMIVVLSRGNFCPKDQVQHRLLVDFYPELQVGYTKIVTISTDDVRSSRIFRSTVAAEWPFLADPERVIQKDLEIQEYTDPKNDPMIPHVIVLEPGLVVHKVYNGYWFWGRPSVEDLRQDLRAIFSTRPDWDATAAGLREAWDADDKSSFFPYTAAPARTPAGARAR
jgi:peroxiredoxin